MTNLTPASARVSPPSITTVLLGDDVSVDTKPVRTRKLAARKRKNGAKLEAIYVQLGARIARLREENGMSQAALTKRLKWARGRIPMIEAARTRLMLHHIEPIAKALEKNPQELLQGIWD